MLLAVYSTKPSCIEGKLKKIPTYRHFSAYSTITDHCCVSSHTDQLESGFICFLICTIGRCGPNYLTIFDKLVVCCFLQVHPECGRAAHRGEGCLSRPPCHCMVIAALGRRRLITARSIILYLYKLSGSIGEITP